MKLVALPLILALIALAFSTSAGATTTSRATGQSFCGVARGVARDIMASTAVGNGGVVPANIRTMYTKIAAAEPALLSAAPASLKLSLRPVFGFVNLVIIDFKKVNWNPSTLAPYAPTLIARARAVQGHMHTLKVYFNTTCKLGI